MRATVREWFDAGLMQQADPERHDELVLANAYAQVFDTPAGHIVLQDLSRVAGFMRSAVVPGDPYLTHYNDGMRSLFGHIYGRLKWTESKLAILSREISFDELMAMRGQDLDPEEAF